MVHALDVDRKANLRGAEFRLRQAKQEMDRMMLRGTDRELRQAAERALYWQRVVEKAKKLLEEDRVTRQ